MLRSRSSVHLPVLVVFVALFFERSAGCREERLLERFDAVPLLHVGDVKARYGVETLEEAFFAATGREFEEEGDEDDEIREVFG